MAPSSAADIPGLTWHQAANVARPDSAFVDTTTGSIPPEATGRAGHPGHFIGQAIISDVAAGTDGRMVAVGSVGVAGSWTAAAWTTTDGTTWVVSPIDATPGSFAVGVAAIPGGFGGGGAPGARFIAVGRLATNAVAWTSIDGSTWNPEVLPSAAGVPNPPGSDAERATSVLVTEAGIVVGGSKGPELGSRVARIWRSTDAAAWTAAPDSGAFADAEVTALAAGSHGVVAVGHSGSGETPTGSVAWTWNGDRTWARSDDPALARVLVQSVTSLPDGTLVAVGSGGDQQPAVALRSPDGRTWTAAPDQAALDYHGLPILMSDVVAVPAGVVAVGEYSSLQRPTAMSWISPDGVTWTRSDAAPELEQGVMAAVTRMGNRLVAVGDYGLPDDFVPTIWLGTAPGG